MLNRVALFAASLVASLVLAIGLALAGFAPAAPAAGVAVPAAATTDAPAPITQIDTVYVAPQAKPEQVTVQQVVTSHHGDDEGGGDD